MNEMLGKAIPDDVDRPEWYVRLEGWRHLGSATGLTPLPEARVPIEFATDVCDYDQEPDDANLRHVEWLVEHHVALLRDAVLEAALRLHRGYRMEMVPPEQEDGDIPILRDHADIVPLIMPLRIHLTSLPGVEMPYLGLSFWADWDAEHGIGIMTRGMEVVSMPGSQHLDGGCAQSLEEHRGSGKMLDEEGYEISRS